MEIVVAELEDINELSELFNAYRVSSQQDSDLAGAEDFLRQGLENQESYSWLAILEEQVVGFVMLYPSFSSGKQAQQWQLSDLYVTPSARRQGVAQGLIKEVLAFSQGTESPIFIEIPEDQSVTQGLYESMGFIREKNDLFFYGTERND